MEVRLTKETYLKAKPIQAAQLSDAERMLLPIQTLPVAWAKLVQAHWYFELEQPIQGRYNWYAWAEHSDVYSDGQRLSEKPSIPATVPPFWPQTDNYTQPDRTCNTSATAMALAMLGAKIKSDDELLHHVVAHGDSTDHSLMDWLCKEFYGITAKFHYDMDWEQLCAELDSGRPVVMGILHRGPLSNPRGGHMICAYANGIIAHDPYGSLIDGYSSSVSNGRAIHYSKEILDHRWLAGGQGWGRIFR